MKQSNDYKKQLLRHKLPVVLGILCMLLLPYFVYGQTAEELQNRINEKSADIEKIEQEIKSYQSQLNNIGAQKDSLANQIKQLDLTKKKLNADINLTEKKIEKTNLKISSLNTDIGKKESSISNNERAVMAGLRRVNEIESDNLILTTLLAGNNFADTWTDVDNMISIREKVIKQIGELTVVKNELVDTRDETTVARNELSSLKNDLSDQKKITEQNTKEKNNLLKLTKNNEANYQKLLREQTAKKLALEQELRDFESKLKYILDPSTLPSAGVLAWPIDNVYVTQLFGKTVAAKRLYASGSHSGVDFRASVGTPVKSMAGGTVRGFGDTDTTCPGASFGKWIFIEFDNGLSATYGHLSLQKVYTGQKVSRGEVVGYSGATGRVTGPHLHITLYASSAAGVQTVPSKSCSGKTLTQPLAATNAYLDPMIYLPPYKN
ncbi:MAG: peptidoglycan DD-metalloendopeptidase family protein [Candidatus Pacebacteria bacterium]|nr:peptidoglycan DD-metalloendopeptidase family protein [Candidatus Paceibacterota bacterium]MBP9851267.1 peptidoglycan DD-metalloendopeptidase family protein [Candidatus Paceibacterota bacterium]